MGAHISGMPLWLPTLPCCPSHLSSKPPLFCCSLCYCLDEPESCSLNFSVTVPRDPPGRGWCQAPPWAPDGGPVGPAVGHGTFPLLLLVCHVSSKLRARDLVEMEALGGPHSQPSGGWWVARGASSSLLLLSFPWEWMAWAASVTNHSLYTRVS